MYSSRLLQHLHVHWLVGIHLHVALNRSIENARKASSAEHQWYDIILCMYITVQCVTVLSTCRVCVCVCVLRTLSCVIAMHSFPSPSGTVDKMVMKCLALDYTVHISDVVWLLWFSCVNTFCGFVSDDYKPQLWILLAHNDKHCIKLCLLHSDIAGHVQWQNIGV